MLTHLGSSFQGLMHILPLGRYTKGSFYTQARAKNYLEIKGKTEENPQRKDNKFTVGRQHFQSHQLCCNS